jgi:hypothetical protein
MHGMFLVALVVASLLFVLGASYFLHLPHGLRGAERAGTADRNAMPDRVVALGLLVTLLAVVFAWLALAGGTLAAR